MNDLKRFLHLDSKSWPEWLKRWYVSESRQHALIWMGRFAVLFFITIYFVLRMEEGAATSLPAIRRLLLLFWGYVVLAGIIAVYRPQRLFLSNAMLVQVIFELAIISAFLYYSGEPTSPIYYTYFLPLLVAADSLRMRHAFLVLLLALVGFALALVRITDPVLNALWPRATFMALNFTFFLLNVGRRRTVIEDAVTGHAEVMAILKEYDEGVYVIDGENRLRYVNAALIQKHGSAWQGKKCQYYFQCGPDLCSWYPSTLTIPENAGQLLRRQGIFIDNNGDPYRVETLSYPLAGENAESIGAIVFVRNIEERHQLENRLQHLTSQRLQWRKIYEAMGKRLVGFSNLDELMQALVNETAERVHAETSALFLLEGGWLVRKAIVGVEPTWFANEKYAVGQGITGRAVQPPPNSKYAQPQLVNDVDTNPDVVPPYLAKYVKKLASRTVKHLIAIPLNSPSGTFGVLRLVNRIDEHGRLAAEGFTADDVESMAILAAMVALAIENTRLLEDKDRQLRATADLYAVSKAITQTLDLEQLLSTVVDSATRLTGGFKAVIHLVDESSQLLIREAYNGPQKYHSGLPPMKVNDGVAGRAIRQRRMVYVPDTNQDEGFVPRGSTPLRSLLVIPLLAGKRVLGLLSVNGDMVNAFTEEHLEQLNTLGSQAALAIEKAQLYRKTRALHHVTELLNTNLSKPGIFKQVLPKFRDVVAFDSISIQLLDGDHLRIIYAWGFDDDKAVHEIVFPADDSKYPNYRVLTERQPVIVDDVRVEYPHFWEEREKYHTPHITNWLGVPLIRENRVMGMVSIDKKTADYYTEADGDLALAFANHLAIAIDNGLLYEKSARQAQMLVGLVETSQGLITHTMLNELHAFSVTKGAAIFDVEDCSLTIIDEPRRVLELVASSCLPPEVCRQSAATLDEKGLRAHVAKTGEILNFGGEEYKEHPAWNGRVLSHLTYLPSGICHSLLMGPVVDSEGRIIGILRLENKCSGRPNKRFNEFEVALYKTFASHIGMAIERALLFARLDAEAQKKARASLGHDLHDTTSFIHGALVLRTAAARSALSNREMDKLAATLDHLHKAAMHTYSSIRRLHFDTRDPALQELGLVPTLKRAASLLPLPPLAATSGDQVRLPPDIEYALYRIGQEALSNIARHAGSYPSVRIELKVQADAYQFTVSDTGIGFDVDPVLASEDSFGFQGMQRWATAVGALLKVCSQPGRGSSICIIGSINKGEENEHQD
jgi:GAF domain-containing protein/PAS domain-containing protein